MHQRSYLSDDLRRFGTVNGFQILLHSGVIIPLFMKVISILSENYISLRSTNSGFLCQVDRHHVEISLIKNFEFLLQRLFMIAKQLLR